jgi:hypothetical protein
MSPYREDCTSYDARAISFKSEWKVVIREYWTGVDVTSSLNFMKESF